MSWGRAELLPLRVEIDEAEGRVTIFTLGTPAGEVGILAEVSENGTTLILDGVHIEGPGANAVGIACLRTLAEVVMEELGYDAIDIQGAPRTTGANPGQHHRPRLRLIRRRGSVVPGPGQGQGGDGDP